jgi:UDP-glucose 4-epimerase
VRTLVTGGAGFIGSNLVDALLARGDEVTILDDLSTGRLKNLEAALAAGAILIEGSIADADTVAAALDAARPEVIYHLAAQIDVRRAVDDPAFDATVNVVGTATLLEAARHMGVRRMVLASTGGAIYGDADVVPTPEGTEPRPLSPYAASKASAEIYMGLYRRLYGLSTFALRLANVYGPRQDPKGEAGVIAIYCGRAVEGGRATVYGDGLQTRDFVFVGDVVEAFMAAGDSDADGYCNVSTGRETTVLELAEVLGLEPEAAPERAGEVRRSCLDPAAAGRLLGWSARTSLRDGLEYTVASARAEIAAAATAA